ncbi:MAG: type II secretion system F family protein, partial [Pyrinomonadaceae bacterium]|nr:type II secretion system F family protein [Phycisphaerales bacterium]
MPSFQYTAISTTGERIVGVLTGGNEQAVLAELESRKLTPVAVAPAKERAKNKGRKVSPRQLAGSYLQLADLLRAGVPLLRGIKLLGSRKSAPALSKVFSELAAAVADGTELAAAMEARPEVFPRVHIAMVRAGEKGGFLEAVLARLGQFLTAQAQL